MSGPVNNVFTMGVWYESDYYDKICEGRLLHQSVWCYNVQLSGGIVLGLVCMVPAIPTVPAYHS